MKAIKGIPASAGLALGTARYLRHVQNGLGRAVGTPREEQETFDDAIRRAQSQLTRLGQNASAQDRDIFMVQNLLLEDSALQKEIASYIKVGASAAAAVERAAGIFAQRIRSLEDPYMRERACDILDACRRVVKILDDQPHETLRLNGPAILVAEELYPTDIAMLDRSLVQGFVTIAGSPDAHAAIIARTMGIPAGVMADAPEALTECDGLRVALDGDTGEVFLDPDSATQARFAHRLRQQRRHMVSQQQLRSTPCVTRDGTHITLLADCTSPEDIHDAIAVGADGVGLLLGEYRLAASAQDEDAQYRFYCGCLEAARGKPVYARVFDEAHGQPGPAMGLCGTRYCLENPEFFETQLRALLRAGVLGNLYLLLPMVSTRAEQDRAAEAVERAKAALRERGTAFSETVPIGLSLDTPAAALTADELARRAAFFHLNTDTLGEHTFAVDRDDLEARKYLPPLSPAIFRLIRFAVDAARQAHIPLCICGENASRPVLAETYVRAGIRTFSLPPREMLAVKAFLMGVTL